MSESGDSAGGTNKGVQRLRDAFDKVKKLGFIELDSLLDENVFVDVFTPVKGEVKRIMTELSAIKVFEDFTTKCDITKTSPKYLMCLFLCGFLESKTMSLKEWEAREQKPGQKDKFDKFQQEFLAYLENPTACTYVEQYVIDKKVWENFEEEHAKKEMPADLCIIRDNTMSMNDCVLDVYTGTTDYTAYNIEVWPIFFVLSLRLQSKIGCFGVTSATDASYIFLYNLPDRDKMLEKYSMNKEKHWEEYIEKPITLYRSAIQKLNVTPTQIVSNIKTKKREDCVFLYVHLFILLTLPNYEKNRFYSRYKEKTFEFTTGVLAMSGMTYEDIKSCLNLNEVDQSQDIPFTSLPSLSQKERGFGRIASKYLELLGEEPVYTEPLNPSEFFPITPYINHEDFLKRDNHAVVYDWVFHKKLLLDDNTWQIKLPTASADDWQKIDTCRRVYHAMWPNLGGNALRNDALPFFVKLEKGKTIENNQDRMREAVVELDFEVDYRQNGITTPTVDNFVNLQTQEVKIAIQTYFGAGPYTVSDLAYKYAARLTSNNSLIVLDSHDWVDKAGGGSTPSIKSIPLQPLPPTEEPKFGMLRPQVGPVVRDAQSNSDSEDSEPPAKPDTSFSSRGGTNKHGLKSLIDNLERVTVRHALEISTRRKRLESLSALTKEQKNEHAKELEALEKLQKDLKDLDAELQDAKGKQQEAEDLSAEKDKTLAAKVEEIKALEKKLEDLEEKNKLTDTESQDKIKELEKKLEEFNEEKKTLEETIKQKDDLIEEKDKTLAAKEEEIKALEKKLEELEEKIAGLENDIKEKETITGALEKEKKELNEQITALKDQNQALENEKDQIKLSKDGDTQQNAQAVAALEQDKDKLQQEVQSLTTINEVLERKKDEIEGELDQKEEEISELMNETEAAEKALLNATKNMDNEVSEELKDYDTVMSEGMKIVVTADMREKLRKGELKEFYELVKKHPSKKETYSNAALFLVLESMGGTWKMAVENNTKKDAGENYDEIITEKVIYDLRQWDSIGNVGKVDMRHTSKDFQAFVAAFGLTDVARGSGVFRPSLSQSTYRRPSTKPAKPADAGP